MSNFSDYHDDSGEDDYREDDAEGWVSFEQHTNSGITTAEAEAVSLPCRSVVC